MSQDGIYKLTFNDLNSANFPVEEIDPRSIQLFHRGIEQSIKIEGQGDASFDAQDYIQFYGQRNDGTLDKSLYKNSAVQPHSYYNIYSDTTAYFLTWSLDASVGKRIIPFFENNVDGIPTETHHISEILMVNSDQYAPGFTQGDFIQKTAFDTGEGWSGIAIQENQEVDYTFTGIEKVFTSQDKPFLELQLVGRDHWVHQVEILVGENAGSLRSIEISEVNGYNTLALNHSLEWSDISTDGELVVRVRGLGGHDENDLLSVNYLKVSYPQFYDMKGVSNQVFHTKTSPNSKSFLEIKNKPTGLMIWDVSDENSPIIVNYNNLGDDLNLVLPNTSVPRKLLATNETLSATSISKIDFNNFDPRAFDYIIISHSSMMGSSGDYDNVVEAYANYRKSESGGGYNPLILDIDELYNQFNYGEKSPLAIYKAMEYLIDIGSPKFLFIIGKGLLVNTTRTISGAKYHYRKSPEMFVYKDYIPTAGLPGSDLTFTVDINEPGKIALPTGRITTTTPSQVASYLDKVKVHESSSRDDLWRKRILHLSGGKTTAEQTSFKFFVDAFKTIAESHHLGGEVTSLKKQTSAVDEFINVTEEINNGVGLVTFYGHSAPNITDVDIGFVSDPVLGFDNKDRYPFILVNGCNAGQTYNRNYGWGEDWVFTPDKGAVGFIAHSSFGLDAPLVRYSTFFYENAFSDLALIDQPIGVIQQEVINDYISTYGTGIISETITQQMVLQGDPAVPIFGVNQPDYVIGDSKVFFKEVGGQEINALADEFQIGIIIENVGVTEEADINVRIKRRLEDNTLINYDTIFPIILFKDTVYVNIQNDIQKVEGRNVFEIEVDYIDQTTELNENNNTAIIEKIFLSNGTINLLPIDFSIVSNGNIKLISQASNLQTESENRSFEFEIDTVSTFSSTYKYNNKVSGQALTALDVDLLAKDSLTYYWRTRFENAGVGESDTWKTSSFTYIEDGDPGWIQKHRQQFEKNEFIGLNHNESTGKISFENSSSEVSVTTYGSMHSSGNYESVELMIDGQQFIYQTRLCRDNTLNIVAFNKLTTTPYVPIPSSINAPQTCGRTDQIVNSFSYSEMSGASEYLKLAIDAIQDNDRVLIFSIGDPQFSNWDASLRSQIERVGGLSTTISSLTEGAPYILLGKKGETPGSAQEVTSQLLPANEQSININETILGVLAEGEMTSTIIGPAKNWDLFFNKITADNDDFNFDVYGLNYDGDEIRLNTTASQIESLENVDATQYPFLKLNYKLDDTENITATQLGHWGVHYEPVPEGVLIMKDIDKLVSAEEGELVVFNFQFINISTIDFSEDLRVDYSVLNKEILDLEEFSLTIEPPKTGDTTAFSIVIDSKGIVGLNDFNLIVNPRLFPEQNYDNNQIQLYDYLEILPDQTAPVIDVVFDGAHIEHGGIVSSTPDIEILVYDNNESLYISDTSSVDVYLKRGCEDCIFERLNYSSDSVSWNGANMDQHFKILYNPSNLIDSLYTLQVVAADASGNKPSEVPYEISFTTDKRSSIKYFHPYPNPSNSEINFTFEIRGSEPLDEVVIEFFNAVGAHTFTIISDDLRVGLNTITYTWDDSELLIPEGMYIYKIEPSMDGEVIYLDTSISNGRGKLFLSR